MAQFRFNACASVLAQARRSLETPLPSALIPARNNRGTKYLRVLKYFTPLHVTMLTGRALLLDEFCFMFMKKKIISLSGKKINKFQTGNPEPVSDPPRSCIHEIVSSR